MRDQKGENMKSPTVVVLEKKAPLQADFLVKPVEKVVFRPSLSLRARAD
jgi:hypothetical protein